MINQKRDRVIREIAIHLIEQGKIKQAEEVLQDTNTEMRSFGVFDALLGRHIKMDDVQAIHELMRTVDRTLEELDPDAFENRFIRGIRNRCLHFLATRALETGEKGNALALVEEISVPGIKIEWYREFLERLINQGEKEEAKQVVNRILDILDEETEWEAEDLEYDESIGNIDWRGTGRERKQFSLHNRAKKLIELAEQLIKHDEFDDVVEKFIDGSEADGKDGITFAIEHSSSNGQDHLRGRLMELFAARGDWKRMDEEYHEALRRHPDRQDDINTVLAEILEDKEPEQAKEIILSLSDPKKKSSALSDFYLTGFEGGTIDVSQWRTYAREIETIEDELLNKGEWNADIAELLEEDGIEEPVPEGSDPSLATVTHFGSWSLGTVPTLGESFWRISPSFISSTATIAFQKGRYEVIKEVLSDARVDLNSKIGILHDVSMKVRGGEEM